MTLQRSAAADVGLDGCQFLQLFGLGKLSLLFVGVPMLYPHEETLLFVVHHTMNLPVEVGEPLKFHHVELLDGDAANFSPGSVLKCVVVEELAAKEKAGGEHAIDRARR